MADAEVIDACKEYGMDMAFTNTRLPSLVPDCMLCMCACQVGDGTYILVVTVGSQ